jgi:hypothetical protein
VNERKKKEERNNVVISLDLEGGADTDLGLAEGHALSK